MNWTNVWSVITWMMAGPGAGWAAFQVMNRIPWPDAVTMETKRFVSIALTMAIAIVAWLILVWVGKQPLPIGAIGWFEQAFAVAGSAYITSQAIHGATILREADKVNARLDAIVAAASDEDGYLR